MAQQVLNLPLNRLADIQGNLHRLGFAEYPLEQYPDLPKEGAARFFKVIESKGVQAAIDDSIAIDSGFAAAAWRKSRAAEWRNPIFAWDDCTVDLPIVGEIITAGFTSKPS